MSFNLNFLRDSRTNWTYIVIVFVLAFLDGVSLVFLSKEDIPFFGVLYPKSFLLRDVSQIDKGVGISGKDIRDCLEKDFFTKKTSTQSENSERERKLSYIIFLKSRHFEPVGNSNEALKCFNFLQEQDKYYAFIQLYDSPSDQHKSLLSSKGIELLDYIPKNAWFASFSEHLTDKQVQELSEIIRWVGVIRPEDKVYEDLWRGEFGSWAVEGDSVLVTVWFFDDVSREKAEELLQRYDGEISSRGKVSNRYAVKIPRDSIKKIAEENVVRYIDQKNPPAEISNIY